MKKGTLVNERYRILCQIGKGGTSEVYKVYDTHVTRELAMKVIKTDTPNMIVLARSEIEMLKSIKYPLFPEIFDAFCDERFIYIISEFIYGRRLDEVIKDKGLSRDESLRIIGRVAEAISYLHDFKPPILYLDLKPENIILNEASLPVLIDFGIAGRLMDKRVCMGTYGYSPPEQYGIGAQPPDERADIFSLGMTYLALRSATPPKREYLENIEFIKQSPIFSKQEKAFLLHACAYNKSDRFSCMTIVRREIQRIRDYPKKTLRKITVFIGLISVATALVFLLRTKGRSAVERQAALTMVGDASQYMKDGEYTREGMGIIRSFVESGCLSEETEQNFLYEMAWNSLYIQRDYKSANVFYSKLNKQTYPFAEDYIRLCGMLSKFVEEPDASRLVGIYYNDVLNMPDSEDKYENLLIAADLFEMYDVNRLEGIKKSIAVLEDAVSILDAGKHDLSNLSKEQINKYKEEMINKIKKKEDVAKGITATSVKGGISVDVKTDI